MANEKVTKKVTKKATKAAKKKVVKKESRGKASISMTLKQATVLQTTLAKKGRRQRFLDRKIAQAEIEAK